MSFEELFPIQYFSADHWQALIPLMLMSITGVIALVLSPWKNGRIMAFSALCAGSVLALLALAFMPLEAPLSLLGGVLVADRLSQIFSVLVIAAGLASALTSLGFDLREHIHSAILLYGVSLLYGTTGSLRYDQLAHSWQTLWPEAVPVLPVIGLVMVGIGFLFKVGAVPFHVWIPDVYTGASTPVTGLMISGVKAAAIGALLRFTAEVFALPGLLALNGSFYWILWAITAATLLFGALLGLQQTSLKRMFAYSTIAHTGYVLLGFMALIIGQKAEAAEAIVSYTLFYVVMNLGGFAVLTLLSPKGSDEPFLKDLAGLGQRQPFVAFALSLFLMSMAGIPPTAGFFGKYYLFSAALSAGEVSLTILAAIASIISAAFYLRPLVYMYMKGPAERKEPSYHWLGSMFVISFAAVLTLAMGILPQWFSGFFK
ncbi:MAG: NADH-quinone oxidoreductase subunit N [Proteobacteria bacterium]|nr:NADH-quinone oxidoreductase subunit N [Pseudomonadota bacterium]